MLACESHLLCRAVLITIFAEVGAMDQRLDGATGKHSVCHAGQGSENPFA